MDSGETFRSADCAADRASRDDWFHRRGDERTLPDSTNASEYVGNPFLLIKFPAIFVGLLNVAALSRLPAWKERDARALSMAERRQLSVFGGISLLSWLTAIGAGRLIGTGILPPEAAMKKVMCGVLMLGWIPTLAIVAGARWTDVLFAQGKTPLKVTRIYTGPDRIRKAKRSRCQ